MSHAITTRMDRTGFIVVSGLPASGKTAIGHAVAARLGFPFLDTDDFLKARFEHFATVSPDRGQRLSRESDADVIAQAATMLVRRVFKEAAPSP